MKRTLLFTALMLTSITMLAQEKSNDYLPFVELGKKWHVVSNPTNPYAPCSFERLEMYDEEERDGKTYVTIGRIDDGQDTDGYQKIGLFREENRRVYKYEAGRDIMMYDFSLKEGDTFTYEVEPGYPMNCKVLKQGWLEDGPQIVSSYTTTSADIKDIKYRKLRTWTIGFDNGSGKYIEAITWIECIGALKNMFYSLDNVGVMSCLAYIERNRNKVDYLENEYLPFSLQNMYGPVYGCNLPKGEIDMSEDWDNQFTFELEGNRLHVYGKVVLNCGCNNYAYFTEEPTDDPLVRKLRFRIEQVGPLTTCVSLYSTDFYVQGINPAFNYIVVGDDGEEHPVINKTTLPAYRPFIEDDKEWVVKVISNGWPTEEWIEYYYFDGDTIVNGQTAKRMLCDRIDSSQDISGKYVGAWYEQDKKVYYAEGRNQPFKLLYDFTLSTGETLKSIDIGENVQVTKMMGGIPGFKGTYYNLTNGDYDRIERWYEGVGSEYYPWLNLRWFRGPAGAFGGNVGILLACCVNDEIIYYNSEEGDPYIMGARKKRFDFTHTTKEKPKTRTGQESEQSPYGEYNEQRLGINLDPLNDVYLVHITDGTGKAVYEKTIDAVSIVALNIDISSYPKGSYTVTVENGHESFTGYFDTQATGIETVRNKEEVRGRIYNLQGQRLSSLQKGLNIVNGQKVYVK